LGALTQQVQVESYLKKKGSAKGEELLVLII